jgi:hypothetical protein
MLQVQRAWQTLVGRVGQRNAAILAGVAGLLVVCACCASLSAVTGSGDSGNGSARSSSRVTAGPTAPPTARPAPTATLTPQQTLTRLVTSVANTHDYTVTVALQDGGVVIVTETLKPNSIAASSLIKLDMFTIQRTLWTKWHGPLTEVDVNVEGPLQDAYGNVSTGLYAHTQLTAATASLFNWANLDQDSAWNVYDAAYIRSDI